MIDLIKATKEFQLRNDILKQQMADVEQEYIDTLNANKDCFDKEFLNFFYWDTDLKTTYVQPEGKHSKQLYMHVDKNVIGTYECVLCYKEFPFARKSRSHRPNVICESCQKKLWGSEQERAAAQKDHQEELRQLKTMPYKDYLQTEHWKNFRKRAYGSANYKCQLCNAAGTLHVHHRTYERRGEEQYKDVIVLCASCHARFHGKEAV